MNIYLSHSRGDFDYEREFYEPCEHALAAKHHLILPHRGQSPPNAKETFRRGDCELILAEVTFPSTGQGIELAWAADHGIRIIAVHRSDARPSPSLDLLKVEWASYDATPDLVRLLKQLV